MTSVQELSRYKNHHILVETCAAKTAATTYDFPENPLPARQKDKKWSFSSLFRRKKRDDGSESRSSSENEASKKTAKRSKRKVEKSKKKKVAALGNFDHIVPTSSRQSYYSNSLVDDSGVLSDPSGGFGCYIGRPLPRIPNVEVTNNNSSLHLSHNSLGSAESCSKKTRRERNRGLKRQDSSSDEDKDSQRSHSSSRLKSDDNLALLSRKSRGARTERYIRRLSKDEESILNREAVLLATIPQSCNRMSNSQASLNHSQNQSYYSNAAFVRSVSYEADINTKKTPVDSRRVKNRSLGYKYPPAPPPRDPRRILTMPDNHLSLSYLNKGWAPNYREESSEKLAAQEVRPASANTTQRCVTSEKFQYLTDKKPRSRKPIVIQSNQKANVDCYKTSPQIFTAQSRVRTNIFLPSVCKSDLVDSRGVDTVDFANNREASPFKPISSPTITSQKAKESEVYHHSSIDSLAEEVATKNRKKSTNLEEALDELEAIYKSLHLGDEDLLERAEQRELSAATKRLIESKAESYPDESFSYESYESLETPRRRNLNRRSQTFDRKSDDMAFRKMNRERSSTIGDPQSVVSYLLASPVHNGSADEPTERVVDEPDVTLDDVVFRNIKHANDSLKIGDIQLPFGIPIGPISPAPNSDYLHAIPENTPKYSFHRKRIPDIVKDDWAYRNLRKDYNKEPVLKSTDFSASGISPDDFENNNVAKKQRAVRSLSANISNLLQKDSELDNIADAMEIARQILKEKEEKISATKRAFLSDSETKYKKFGAAESITESRMNFLNNMKFKVVANEARQRVQLLGEDYLDCKPPKSVTPERRIPKSPSKEKSEQSVHSSLEELLTAFAVEARETSDRINSDLMKLDEEFEQQKIVNAKAKDSESLSKTFEAINNVNKNSDNVGKTLEVIKNASKNSEDTNILGANKNVSKTFEGIDIISKHAKMCEKYNNVSKNSEAANNVGKTLEVNKNASKNSEATKNLEAVSKTFEVIDKISEHAKMCEKLLDCVVESTDLISSHTNTGHVENMADFEELEPLEEELLIPESVVNICSVSIAEGDSSSEPDYVNLADDKSQLAKLTNDKSELGKLTNDKSELANLTQKTAGDLKLDNCISPFEEHKAELIASFQELGKMIDEACMVAEEVKLGNSVDLGEDSTTESGQEIAGNENNEGERSLASLAVRECCLDKEICLLDNPDCLKNNPNCLPVNYNCLQFNPNCLQFTPDCLLDDKDCLLDNNDCLTTDECLLEVDVRFVKAADDLWVNKVVVSDSQSLLNDNSSLINDNSCLEDIFSGLNNENCTFPKDSTTLGNQNQSFYRTESQINFTRLGRVDSYISNCNIEIKDCSFDNFEDSEDNLYKMDFSEDNFDKADYSEDNFDSKNCPDDKFDKRDYSEDFLQPADSSKVNFSKTDFSQDSFNGSKDNFGGSKDNFDCSKDNYERTDCSKESFDKNNQGKCLEDNFDCSKDIFNLESCSQHNFGKEKSSKNSFHQAESLLNNSDSQSNFIYSDNNINKTFNFSDSFDKGNCSSKLVANNNLVKESLSQTNSSLLQTLDDDLATSNNISSPKYLSENIELSSENSQLAEDSLASLESLQSPKLVSHMLKTNLQQSTEDLSLAESQFSSLDSSSTLEMYKSQENLMEKIPENVFHELSVVKVLSNFINYSPKRQEVDCLSRETKSCNLEEFIEELEVDEDEKSVLQSYDGHLEVVKDLENSLEVDDHVEIINKELNEKITKEEIPSSSKLVEKNITPSNTINEASANKVTKIVSSKNNLTQSNRSSSSKTQNDSVGNFTRNNDKKSSKQWYEDPLLLALACYYSFACTYQLATLDAVTLLGLLFVVVSVIAALVL